MSLPSRRLPRPMTSPSRSSRPRPWQWHRRRSPQRPRHSPLRWSARGPRTRGFWWCRRASRCRQTPPSRHVLRHRSSLPTQRCPQGSRPRHDPDRTRSGRCHRPRRSIAAVRHERRRTDRRAGRRSVTDARRSQPALERRPTRRRSPVWDRRCFRICPRASKPSRGDSAATSRHLGRPRARLRLLPRHGRSRLDDDLARQAARPVNGGGLLLGMGFGDAVQRHDPVDQWP